MWKFKKPTKTGYYMINNGDVETELSMQPAKIYKNDDGVLMVEFFDRDIVELSQINRSFKYLRIKDILPK